MSAFPHDDSLQELIRHLVAIRTGLDTSVAALRMVLPRVAEALQKMPLPVEDLPKGMDLRVRRCSLGLSQRALAEYAYVSRGLVAAVEAGDRSSPWTLALLDRTLGALEEQRQAVPHA